MPLAVSRKRVIGQSRAAARWGRVHAAPQIPPPTPLAADVSWL